MIVKEPHQHRIRHLPLWIGMCISLVLITAAVLLDNPSTASAEPGDLALVEAKYPNMAGSRIDACTFCHTSSIPSLNAFGLAYRSNGRNTAALTAIESLDSDGDGFTNLQEVTALTFPGNASDVPAAGPTNTPTTGAYPPPATRTNTPTTGAYPPPATPTSTATRNSTPGSGGATATSTPTTQVANTATRTPTTRAANTATRTPTTRAPSVTPTQGANSPTATRVTSTPSSTPRVTNTSTARVTRTPTVRVTRTPTLRATRTPTVHRTSQPTATIVCRSDGDKDGDDRSFRCPPGHGDDDGRRAELARLLAEWWKQFLAKFRNNH